MDWRISKSAFLADFILVPIYAALALAGGLIFAEPTPQWFGLFAVGFVAWTLVEYGMHRFLFHHLYRREHGLHHIRPADYIGVSPFVTGAGFILLWLTTVHFLGGIGRGGAAFAGFVSGYYTYITIHFLIHHTNTMVIAKLRAAHESHHRGASGNFGVVTSVWDRAFGTYRV
jgi:sterol desaturase/sphingolipid hydroxylase (fatty acid hydroxylase superfamily)